MTDCADQDCFGDAACVQENCFDPNADDNGDGDFGCDDATCTGEPVCDPNFQGFWIDYILKNFDDLPFCE